MNLNSKILIQWYKKNKRELPWRHTKDAYPIWISEIILQQTQVSQGLNYYEKFLEVFPSIEILARASTEQILAVWQGLGYYYRALNMLETAQYIQKKHSGQFPKNYQDLLGLKGIGPYTAAAIASIAFDLPYPVVDGNVKRVLSRFYGIGERKTFDKEIMDRAKTIMDKTDPGTFNQALMEFGALQCVPSNPNCDVCPFRSSCKAFNTNKVNLFPPKRKKVRVTDRYLHYFIFLENKKLIVKQRNRHSIWPNLFEFPYLESKKKISRRAIIEHAMNNFDLVELQPKIEFSEPFNHKLSHQNIHATFVFIPVLPESCLKQPGHQLINFSDLKKLPLPRLISTFIERHFHIQ